MISTKSVPSIFFDPIFQDEVLFDISSLPIFKKCFLIVAMFAFFCFPILLLLSCLFLLFSCCCCLILLWYYVLRKRALRICQLVWIYLTKAVEAIPQSHIAYKEFYKKSRNQSKCILVVSHYLGTGSSKLYQPSLYLLVQSQQWKH